MAFKIPEMTQETSTIGTGQGLNPYQLDGAVGGFRTFANEVGNNNDTVYVAYVTSPSVQYVCYKGTYTTNQLSRTTVIRSTSAGADINWANGTVVNILGGFPGRLIETLFSLLTAGSTGILLLESDSPVSKFAVDALPLDIARGGTNATTQADARTQLDAMEDVFSARGEIVYRGASAALALSPGTSGQFLKTNGAGADPSWGTPPIQWPKNYLYGLRMYLATDIDHDITITTHDGRSSDDTTNYTLSSTLTKQIDAGSWSSGNNAGGMPAGLLAGSQTYNIFAIFGASGSPNDAGYDTSATATNLLNEAGASYTKYRKIGELRTDSNSNIESFTYFGADGKRVFESMELAVASGSNTSTSISHLMVVAPSTVKAYLRCKTAEHNYSVGDMVPFGFGSDPVDGSDSNHGVLTAFNSTSIYLLQFVTGVAPQILDRTTPSVPAQVTASKWKFVLRAWE